MYQRLDGKKVLLLCAKFFNYDQLVANQLRNLGARVDLYDARAEITTLEKAVLKVYKGFFLKKLKKYHKKICDKTNGKDYDIIYTNSYLPKETIISYRSVNRKSRIILYMDDSVANTRGIENTFKYYDRVITFDRMDAIEYNLEFVPLFYEDSYRPTDDKLIKWDICFVGTIHSDRLKVIQAIEKECQEKSLSFVHFCYLQSPIMYYIYYLLKPEFRTKRRDYFIYSQLSSQDIANLYSQSKSVLDIHHPKQSGLTMRTIETLGAGKKIITTNNDIIYYDICNDSNVYVINRNNPNIDPSFINGDYKHLDKSIIYNYSIEGWTYKVFKV